MGARAGEAVGVAASIYSEGKLAMSAPAGIAALADTEVGLACRGFAERASSFVRRVFSPATTVQGGAESRLATSAMTKNGVAVSSNRAEAFFVKRELNTLYRGESSLQKDLLSEHFRQCEKYGREGTRFLENGRIRYYGSLTPPETPGAMVGRRVVREWNPNNGFKRTWHEVLDGSGRVRSVRPECNDGLKRHFIFHEDGSYGGIR